jgi:uncharacterized protein YkwD
MKKFIILLCSFLLLGFKTAKCNEKEILLHFEKILNEYRVSNGLNKVVIDESLSQFVNERSKSLVQEYSHEEFYENIYSYDYDFNFAGENIAIVRNIDENDEPYYSSNIEEVSEILNKMARGESTNYDIAMYCFLKWKNSKSHNELLLSNKIKRFHLSYSKSETFYYFCFIALD